MNTNKSLILQTVLICTFVSFSFLVSSQTIYKTPTGKKYHIASCRMVENVSKKLVGAADISAYDLTPCKICHPPEKSELASSFTSENKAVGSLPSTKQCKGTTKKGTRCKHKTRIANGYCYQHSGQF